MILRLCWFFFKKRRGFSEIFRSRNFFPILWAPSDLLSATLRGETALLLLLKMKRLNRKRILPACKALMNRRIDYLLAVSFFARIRVFRLKIASDRHFFGDCAIFSEFFFLCDPFSFSNASSDFYRMPMALLPFTLRWSPESQKNFSRSAAVLGARSTLSHRINIPQLRWYIT